MNIVFFGSSSYCLPILESLKANFNLVSVVTVPDKPVGRKKTLTASPTKVFAQQNNIPALTPANKTELIQLKDILMGKNPDLFVVADYGLIIPQEIFSLPKLRTINIHFSRLPHLRGPSPVQFSLLLGQTATAISVIIMDKTMDTGDILWQKNYPIPPNATTQNLYNDLFIKTRKKLPQVISDYAAGKIILQKQDNSQATYTTLLSKDMGYVPYPILNQSLNGQTSVDNPHDWPIYSVLEKFNGEKIPPAIIIERMSRAFYPWPGIWTVIKVKNADLRLKILKVHLENSQKLVVDTVQLEGKKPVDWKQLQDAYQISDV